MSRRPRLRGVIELRPLDRFGSIKLKLGLAIFVAVAVSAVVSNIVFMSGVGLVPRLVLRVVAALVIALVIVQVLARGMTSPLREMAQASHRMAAGDWTQRVTATSADEVGELARAFNSMAAELAAVDRMRKDLVANVSHELRTPISALQARLENMVDGVEAPDPALLRSMLDQTERLGRLVAQLLDLSRLESGAVPLKIEDVDVATLLDSVAAEARLQSPDRLIEISVEPRNLRLAADPDRVQQVLANLTDNAMRHGPIGCPIRLSAVRDDGCVVLTVTDEGPGIPPDETGRVFERFYRADKVAERIGRSPQPNSPRFGTRAPTHQRGHTATQRGGWDRPTYRLSHQERPVGAGGAGLGLSIARWIVDLHGGEICATANEPEGCAVVCRLPVAPPSGETKRDR